MNSEVISGDICTICGGWKSIAYTIEFRELAPHKISVDPGQLGSHDKLCPGHPEPAQKHDGNLGDDELVGYHHYPDLTAKIVCGPAEFTPAQALSLRDWLIQESPELERIIKEQE